MKRGSKKKNPRGNSRQDLTKEDIPPAESADTANKLALADHEDMEAIQANISAEIKAVRLDVRKEVERRRTKQLEHLRVSWWTSEETPPSGLNVLPSKLEVESKLRGWKSPLFYVHVIFDTLLHRQVFCCSGHLQIL